MPFGNGAENRLKGLDIAWPAELSANGILIRPLDPQVASRYLKAWDGILSGFRVVRRIA